MGDLLQLFAYGYDKWVSSGGRWEVGEWQASIGLYQRQNKTKSSRLNCEY